MEDDNPINRRKEPRYALEAESALHLAKTRQCTQATTVNVSGCGALLELKEPAEVQVGDEVTCECKMPEDAPQALSSWALGEVVRVDGVRVAVDLKAGIFADPGE